MEENLYKATRSWATRTRRELRKGSLRFKKGKRVKSRIKTVYIPSKRFATKSFQVREEKLKDSFKYKIRAKRRIPDRVSVEMAYHALFVERGLGRGRRRPKAFVNPVLEKRMAELSDIQASAYADAAVKAISF